LGYNFIIKYCVVNMYRHLRVQKSTIKEPRPKGGNRGKEILGKRGKNLSKKGGNRGIPG
jgi:hypothetical protein